MQYAVPQFIDVEDKVVGPLTVKQTMYLIAGGGILLILFTYFEIVFVIIAALIIVPLALGFAFYKPKGITLLKFSSNAVKYYTSQHIYIWRREAKISHYKTFQKKAKTKEIEEKHVSKNRIKELAWVLDTSASVNLRYEAKTRTEEEI